MSFPKDVIILLALELDDSSILNLCRISKKYNDDICKNQNFWRMKIERERPGILNSEDINIFYDKDYKNLYKDLKKDVLSINYETGTVIKGDLGFEGTYDIDGIKIGDKVWVLTGYEIDPRILKTREEGIEIIKKELDYIHENLTETGDDENLKDLEEYYRELEDTGNVSIDIFSAGGNPYRFSFNLEETIIL